jgi:hypothetical protein
MYWRTCIARLEQSGECIRDPAVVDGDAARGNATCRARESQAANVGVRYMNISMNEYCGQVCDVIAASERLCEAGPHMDPHRSNEFEVIYEPVIQTGRGDIAKCGQENLDEWGSEGCSRSKLWPRSAHETDQYWCHVVH